MVSSALQLNQLNFWPTNRHTIVCSVCSQKRRGIWASNCYTMAIILLRLQRALVGKGQKKEEGEWDRKRVYVGEPQQAARWQFATTVATITTAKSGASVCLRAAGNSAAGPAPKHSLTAETPKPKTQNEKYTRRNKGRRGKKERERESVREMEPVCAQAY